MRRRWKILTAVVGVLAVLAAINTVILDGETKGAEITVDGGKILHLSTGDIQVTDSGEPAGRSGIPIVLLHCYACSLHWYDKLEPLLARHHRVIRIDFLGFGGSEKPANGYAITDQAKLVAESMNKLGVEGALVAGNSMGGDVLAALSQTASQLVDRAVVIDTAPSTSGYGPGLPLLAKLGHVPVLGEALRRIAPSFAVRSSYADAFSPGWDTHDGFTNPDQVIDDYHAMTYTSFQDGQSSSEDFTGELTLDKRFTEAAVPLMVIFGSDDQIIDADKAIAGFKAVPGVRTSIIKGAGHAPQVEQPAKVAALIEEFAADAGDSETHLPRNVGLDRKGKDRGAGSKPKRGAAAKPAKKG